MECKEKAILPEGEAVVRSGAVAALSVAGVLEIHKALLYSHPVGALLQSSFLLFLELWVLWNWS